MQKPQQSKRYQFKKKPPEKIEQIGKILGLLNEANKGKDWILSELKKRRVRISVKYSMNVFEILKKCPDDFIFYLFRMLINQDFDHFIEIPILTKTFHWFYTDIVGSSNPNLLTKEQAQMVGVLNTLIGKTETFTNMNQSSDVVSITGDGMVIGLSDAPEKPLRLAIELHRLLSKYNQFRPLKNKLRIRIGVETGPVYVIKDLMGKDNFWGPGIIMTRRIMDLARPMQILTSFGIANNVRKLSPEFKNLIHDIGTYKIKHGEKIRLYNIYGEGFGNKLAPTNLIAKQKDEDIAFKFSCPKVELEITVTDPKTMMCHHKLMWALVNISEVESDQVSYFLDGDVPRDFSELNVTAKSADNKKLKISSVDVNKPQHKEFVVKLAKPIKPNQKGVLKIEFDWEEPDKQYLYNLATDCKKFKYFLTVPRNLDIKPRVLKVDPFTKYKTYASPPDVKYLKGRTEVRWEALNLKAHEGYRVEW